jgi:hypothetical protein
MLLFTWSERDFSVVKIISRRLAPACYRRLSGGGSGPSVIAIITSATAAIRRRRAAKTPIRAPIIVSRLHEQNPDLTLFVGQGVCLKDQRVTAIPIRKRYAYFRKVRFSVRPFARGNCV